MTQVLGVGDFIAWDGGCVLIGKAHRATGVHAHYAVQLSFGEDNGIAFRPSEDDEWTGYDGVVIASRTPHAMDASTIDIGATFLVEPETVEGRALAGRFDRGGIMAVERPALVGDDNLFSTWRQFRGGGETVAVARAVVSSVAGGARTSAVSDERILRAVAFVNANLAGPLTLDAVAKEAFLSPTRFRHVFVEQTGTAFRPYVLWRRFLRAWSLMREGAPISAAAHEAGFADAAHLTRTSQRMFGFAPSALLIAKQAESRV
jgi:AraC-like DNA-binding protein